MTRQVDFYVLGKSEPRAKKLLACRIAHKAYGQGLTVFIQTDDPDDSTELDSMLWTFNQGSFVPHGTSASAADNWRDYPVQIDCRQSSGDNIDLLINLARQVPEYCGQFDRIADLVSDDPTDKKSGRARFRYYRDNLVEPRTHNLD